MPSGVNTSGDNVKVVVRSRPLSEQEISQGHHSIIDIDTQAGSISVQPNKAISSDSSAKVFTFDAVFDESSTQVQVYNICARPIINNVLEGYNGTIFAYGQTGTGKTYTMEGNRLVNEEKGIIPNSFAHIFDHISQQQDDTRYLVRVSYLEIYNEEIRDLLAKNHTQRLEVKERPDIGVYVKDLSTVTVSSADEMEKLMSVGYKNRSVGATAMNERSSRSHAIFTIVVECSQTSMGDKQRRFRAGKLHLVDLAGSERQSKTQSTGQRLKEAGKINLSLSTLGNVISALVDPKCTFIPYRNSNLTRLLQDSLGGNSKTLMCANVGPADYNYDETLSTLRYANRAKNIKNVAKINEDPKDALLRKYQQEIEALKVQLDGEEFDDDAEPGTRNRRNISSLEAEIEADKKRLLEAKDEERLDLEEKLKLHQSELDQARTQHDQLMSKLAQIEKRVIVGGENLLEKADEQVRMLNENNAELEKIRAREHELREALESKEAERIDIEEKYRSLEEEAAGKTKKLKKVWHLFVQAKSEMQDLESEHQREIEDLLDNVRELSKEKRLQMLIIDQFVPKHYQEAIERYVHWNDEIGDWELKCIAYTGNNMRKTQENKPDASIVETNSYQPPDFSSVYLTYDGGNSKSRSHMIGASSIYGKNKTLKKQAKADKRAARMRNLLQ